MKIIAALMLIAIAAFVYDLGRDADDIKDAKFIALNSKRTKAINSSRSFAMMEYSDLYEGVRKKIKWDISGNFLGKEEQPGAIIEQGFYEWLSRSADSHFMQGLETLCLIDALYNTNPGLTFQQFLEAKDHQPQYAGEIQYAKLKAEDIEAKLLTMDSPEIQMLVLTTEETRAAIEKVKEKK